MMRISYMMSAGIFAVALAGCTTQQLHDAGQQWGQSLCRQGKATCRCEDGTIESPPGSCLPPLSIPRPLQ